MGVRELKAHLSKYLARVKKGEHIIITERGRPVAMVMPGFAPGLNEVVSSMLQDGFALWGGGKPVGLRRPIRLKNGTSLSDDIIAGRR